MRVFYVIGDEEPDVTFATGTSPPGTPPRPKKDKFGQVLAVQPPPVPLAPGGEPALIMRAPNAPNAIAQLERMGFLREGYEAGAAASGISKLQRARMEEVDPLTAAEFDNAMKQIVAEFKSLAPPAPERKPGRKRIVVDYSDDDDASNGDDSDSDAETMDDVSRAAAPAKKPAPVPPRSTQTPAPTPKPAPKPQPARAAVHAPATRVGLADLETTLAEHRRAATDSRNATSAQLADFEATLAQLRHAQVERRHAMEQRAAHVEHDAIEGRVERRREMQRLIKEANLSADSGLEFANTWVSTDESGARDDLRAAAAARAEAARIATGVRDDLARLQAAGQVDRIAVQTRLVRLTGLDEQLARLDARVPELERSLAAMVERHEHVLVGIEEERAAAIADAVRGYKSTGGTTQEQLAALRARYEQDERDAAEQERMLLASIAELKALARVVHHVIPPEPDMIWSESDEE
jgi:hypothetical protein